MTRATELPADYALVLQQVEESGEEDFTNLAETLNMDHRRLSHVIHALQHKGLVAVNIAHSGREIWVRLTGRGHRLMSLIWPEANAQPAF